MALDGIALLALVISVVALVIALAQLLAQIVGTVEGHRKCQASVMGKWSEHTHRHWRWTQFRFETLFTTPEIVLAPYHPKHPNTIAITGEEKSRTETYVPQKDDMINDPNSELACWVPLLIALHENGAAIFKQSFPTEPTKRAPLPPLSWPAVRKRQRS